MSRRRAGGVYRLRPAARAVIELLRAPLELSRRIILFRSMPHSGDRRGCNRRTRFAQVDVIVLIVQRLPVAVERREESVTEIRRNSGLRLREVGGNG